MHLNLIHRSAAALSLGALLSSVAFAQQPAAAPPAAPAISMVGETAPDFSIRVSTKDGPLDHPFKLSEHKGETIVLAFFVQSRTKG